MTLDQRVREAIIVSTGPDSKRPGVNIDIKRAQGGLSRYRFLQYRGDIEACILISGAFNNGEYGGSQSEAIANYFRGGNVGIQDIFFEPHSNSFAEKGVYLGQGLEKLGATQASLMLDPIQAQRMEILLQRARQEEGFGDIDIIRVREADDMTPSYSGFKGFWKPRFSLWAARYQRLPEKLPFERFLMSYSQLQGFLS